MKTRAWGLLAAFVSVALTLTGCAVFQPRTALPLGDRVPYPAGAATLGFAIDGVREVGQDEWAALGVRTPLADNQAAYFVTYSIALLGGTVADIDRQEAYPDPGKDFTLRGSGNYRRPQFLGLPPSCTPKGEGTQGVTAETPYRSCVIYLGRAGAVPRTVTVADLGTWKTGD